MIQNNIDVESKVFVEDRHVRYEIEASLGISQTAINSIFHRYLTVKKICSEWIPHYSTEAHKEFVQIGVRKS